MEDLRGQLVTQHAGTDLLERILNYPPHTVVPTFDEDQPILEESEPHRRSVRFARSAVEVHELRRGIDLDRSLFNEFAEPALVLFSPLSASQSITDVVLTRHASGYLKMHRTLERRQRVIIVQVAALPNRPAADVWTALQGLYLDLWAVGTGRARTSAAVGTETPKTLTMLTTEAVQMLGDAPAAQLKVRREPKPQPSPVIDEESASTREPALPRVVPLPSAIPVMRKTEKPQELQPEIDSPSEARTLWGLRYEAKLELPIDSSEPVQVLVTPDLADRLRKFSRPAELPTCGAIWLAGQGIGYFTDAGIVIMPKTILRPATRVNEAVRAVEQFQSQLQRQRLISRQGEDFVVTKPIFLENPHAAASVLCGYVTNIEEVGKQY